MESEYAFAARAHVGVHTRLDWVKLDARPGASIDAWKSFHTLHMNDTSEFFSSLRGGWIMWDQVQSILGNSASMVWSFNPPKREGAFTRLQVMVGVRG